MEFKFLMLAIMLAIFPIPTEASSGTCPRWVKLNKSPVCFGAKGNQYGRFSYHRNIFVSSFMLVHRSGKVSCNKRAYSYWGCQPNHGALHVLLTDQNNKILAPEAKTVDGSGSYKLAGYSSSSSVLVFCASKKPQCICVPVVVIATMGVKRVRMCTDSWLKPAKPNTRTPENLQSGMQ
ncbi:unnamed protein product [Porites evermanni]|uniref:Uncharacterized protein n=1 Tax=Porites evermanni TaxID=104178 RepID=A0ABN8T4Y3_9CNID|nr:unnamed protein product [Porites evermanni]